jgi:NAD+ kinase
MQSFKKILIVCSDRKLAKCLCLIDDLRKILEDKHIEYSLVHLIDITKKDIEGVDLVITLGGDGTFTRTSHYLDNTPILGINSNSKESEGFHTTLKDNESHLLKEILNGNFKINQKQRMKTFLNKHPLNEHALDEVYFGTEKQFHASRYKIKHKNIEEEHRSSGILIVTDSGSTAWYKSAGGNPFSEKEKLKFLVREPYQGRIFKPKLLQGEINKGEKITLTSTREDDAIVSIDSNKSYKLDYGDVVEIELSDKPLNVVVLNGGIK